MDQPIPPPPSLNTLIQGSATTEKPTAWGRASCVTAKHARYESSRALIGEIYKGAIEFDACNNIISTKIRAANNYMVYKCI